MTARSKLRRVLAGVGLSLLICLSPSAASAAAPQQGISLSPFEEEIAVQPTDTAKNFNLVLTNHTAHLQELDLKTQDFGSLNDTGGVLLEGSNSYTQRFGLVSWLTLGTDTVILRPGESRSVPVTISNRSDLQPGGHYGAVVASVNSLGDQSGNRVVINQRLLSLILVDKVGGEHFALNLDSVGQNGNWLHLPDDIRLRFENPGNVHVTPRGTVKLVSPGGTVVARGIINEGSAFILPESFRDMYVPLTPVAAAPPLPGLYHLEVDFRYDGLNRYAVKTYRVQFVDLGLYLVAGLVALIALIVAVRLGRRRLKKS